MSRTLQLDRIINTLNNLTNDGTITTVHDISAKAKIDKKIVEKGLEYLHSLDYCNIINNGIAISLKGQLFIESSIFLSKYPFTFVKIYYYMKFIAITLNALLISWIGFYTFINNDLKTKKKEKIEHIITIKVLNDSIFSIPNKIIIDSIK